jgi:cation diffusion facilitator CzcD-associated flavoprotein CzcO
MTHCHVDELEGLHVKIVVVGAGFAGIGTALQLVEHGENSFVVLEQAAEVGGTWRDNIYPGVACDIPSHLYSFSFAPKPNWRHRYGRGNEIHQYLQECAHEPGVAERLHLSTSLYEARWDTSLSLWKITTNRGSFTSSMLVLATGRFGSPHIPKIPGVSTFSGPICHTARWDFNITSGMRVAVLGSGASAIQVAPALAQAGCSVINVQRSPAWIVPKMDYSYSEYSRNYFQSDDHARTNYRQEIFTEAETGFEARMLGSTAQAQLKQRALEFLHTHIEDSVLADLLTPDYEIGCKRVLLSDDFYPAVASGAVSVHAGTIRQVAEQQVMLSDGTATEVDAIVFATGFEASQPPIAPKIFGRRSVSLADHWQHGMVSYASTVVSGFPNMFIVGGPNSALGHNSAITMMEAQITHLISALNYLGNKWQSYEVLPEAELAYTALIDRRAAKTVWLSPGCESWYRHNRNGRLTLLWPGPAREYATEYSQFHPEAFRLVARGPVISMPADLRASKTTG